MKLNEEKILELLDEVCRDLGFCLSPKHRLEISKELDFDARSFAKDVLKAEGFVPEYEPVWMTRLEDRFRKFFKTFEQ